MGRADHGEKGQRGDLRVRGPRARVCQRDGVRRRTEVPRSGSGAVSPLGQHRSESRELGGRCDTPAHERTTGHRDTSRQGVSRIGPDLDRALVCEARCRHRQSVRGRAGARGSGPPSPSDRGLHDRRRRTGRLLPEARRSRQQGWQGGTGISQGAVARRTADTHTDCRSARFPRDLDDRCRSRGRAAPGPRHREPALAASFRPGNRRDAERLRCPGG